MPVSGPHVHDGDPLALAASIGADAVQFFLGDPQDWRAPSFPGGREPDDLRADFEAAGAAAAIGAAGLIVHGGHVTIETDPAEGYDNWRKAIERVHRPLPMLIENTAGGDC